MKRRQGIHPCTRVGGPPEAREWIADTLKPYHAPVIAPTALLQSFVTVDGGCERPTYVGPRALLMAKVHIGHDALIGADVSIAPNSTIEGHAEIDVGAKIGSNVSVLPFRKVGAGAVIGSGSVVTKNVPPGETWAGNPARPMERNPVPFSQRFDFDLAVTG